MVYKNAAVPAVVFFFGYCSIDLILSFFSSSHPGGVFLFEVKGCLCCRYGVCCGHATVHTVPESPQASGLFGSLRAHQTVRAFKSLFQSFHLKCWFKARKSIRAVTHRPIRKVINALAQSIQAHPCDDYSINSKDHSNVYSKADWKPPLSNVQAHARIAKSPLHLFERWFETLTQSRHTPI